MEPRPQDPLYNPRPVKRRFIIAVKSELVLEGRYQDLNMIRLNFRSEFKWDYWEVRQESRTSGSLNLPDELGHLSIGKTRQK